VLEFLVGAGAAVLFVLGFAWLVSLGGEEQPANRSWALFAGALLMLVAGASQQNPTLLGAGAGGVPAMCAFILWGRRLTERRNQEARSAATELGLEYRQQPPSPELEDLARELTSAGSRHKVQRVLSGRRDGRDIRVFDYYYKVYGGRGTTSQSNFTCALISTALGNVTLKITNETVITRIAAKVGLGDVAVGDAEFDRLFRVQCKDPREAKQILGPKVRSWLTENGRGFSFLVGDGAVLCVARQGTTSRADVLGSVLRFADLLPTDRLT